jgi:hypothetical protein
VNRIAHILMVIGIAILGMVIYYSYQHPELTTMQLFIEWWQVLLVSAVLNFVGLLLQDRSR